MKKGCIFVLVLFILGGAVLTAQSKWVISVDGLKMRNGSSFAASPMGIIPYGEKVRMLDRDETYLWAKIDWKGTVGWVHAGFLSGWQSEPLSAIGRPAPAADLLIGTWYKYEPFCPEEKKFKGSPVGASEFTIHEFYLDKGNRFNIRRYEGGASGTWNMSGGQVFLEGEGGYETMSAYTETWNVSFYQIRQDWLVLEIMQWSTDRSGGDLLFVEFLVKPISNSAERKAEMYYTSDGKDSGAPEYFIGEIGPAGGIIFYDKGDYYGGWRYVEAAPINQGRHTWEETKSVIHELEINGYNDWRLPTKKELNLMYEKLYKNDLLDFYTSAYWGVMDGTDTADGMLLSFKDGSWYYGEGNKENNWLVHAVREF